MTWVAVKAGFGRDRYIVYWRLRSGERNMGAVMLKRGGWHALAYGDNPPRGNRDLGSFPGRRSAQQAVEDAVKVKP